MSLFAPQPLILAALALGYLLGSIPFGLVLTRLSGGPDLRSVGSGNIGATNVLRSGSKGLAAATLLLDALKGTAAVLIARILSPDALAAADLSIAAALGAVLGHVFPVWLGFRGGKGVATMLGVLIGLWWPGALAFAAVWLGLAFAFRFSSLAALGASLVIPPLLLGAGRSREATLLALLTVLLWFMHRANIARLLAGTESRIGAKAAPPASPP